MNSVKIKNIKLCSCVKVFQDSHSVFDFVDLLAQKITMTRLRPF